ncbi:unnamed protein product [Pleuronectes platessa]|uniref:Uncharacterized protein n=1 Tax=Pleuronectes platessa TaxID=8262 RepID=A0A9N7Z1E2_PLEPL|nr:unnamed protein product [Pleuronectes platessa]
MVMAEGSAVLRRNRPGTKAKDFYNWPDESFEEMDSTLAVQQYIQQNIRSDCSNIDKILEPPEGQDEGVWKYEHLRQFCLELNGLAVKLQSECHPDTCTQMTATEQWIFLCAAHKTPKECPAIDYTRHTLDGAACLLNSNKYFPSRVSIKESSVAKLGSVCRRIYRIFSHAYFHHRQIFDKYELRNITVKAIRPLVDDVFTRLTAEEWRQLKLGAPSSVTKFLLAELVMNMTSTVTSKLSAALGKEGMSMTVEKVQSSLGDALRKSLAPGGSTDSESLDQFTKLVAEEVTERIKASRASYSTSTQSNGPPRCHQTTPNQLEKMVSCLCRVLKKSASDIQGLFKPRLRSQKTFDLLDKLSPGKTTSSDSDSTSRSRNSDRASTVRSSDRGTSEDVQEILKKELRDILEHLVYEMSESDLSGLISESSLEFKAASDEIYQIISKEGSVKSSAPSRGSESSKIPKGFWKGVGLKIKKLLAKLFGTTSLLKMGTRVQKKFSKETQVQSRESLKSLMDSVESLLLTDTKDRVSPANASVLSDVLYRYITADLSVATPVEETKVSVPKSHRKMYSDIQERVINFLPLMNWWFSKEAGDYTQRVTSALMEIESLVVSHVSEVDTAKEQEASRKKTYVRLLMEQLVTRVYAKAKVNWFFGEQKDITKKLFEKTWAEVQDIDFDVSPKTIDKLLKAVFKDLCKTWGCPEMLLLSIRQKEPENETFLCHRFTRFVMKYNLMSKDNLIVPILEEEVQNTSSAGESEA